MTARHTTDATAALAASIAQQSSIKHEQALATARMEDAFERHYDCLWGDHTMRNERLAWIACWRAAVASVAAQQPAPGLDSYCKPIVRQT